MTIKSIPEVEIIVRFNSKIPYHCISTNTKYRCHFCLWNSLEFNIMLLHCTSNEYVPDWYFWEGAGILREASLYTEGEPNWTTHEGGRQIGRPVRGGFWTWSIKPDFFNVFGVFCSLLIFGFKEGRQIWRGQRNWTRH